MSTWCHAEDLTPSQLQLCVLRKTWQRGTFTQGIQNKKKNEHSLVLPMTLMTQHRPDVIRTLPVDCVNDNVRREGRVTGEPSSYWGDSLFLKRSAAGVSCALNTCQKPCCGRVSQRHCLGLILGSNYTQSSCTLCEPEGLLHQEALEDISVLGRRA